MNKKPAAKKPMNLKQWEKTPQDRSEDAKSKTPEGGKADRAADVKGLAKLNASRKGKK